MPKEYKIVYILGSGHCGSTLLDLLLGSHPKAFSVGELINIRRYIDGAENTDNRCLCGQRFDECNFWQQVLECTHRLKCMDVYELDAHTRMSWRQFLMLSSETRKSRISKYGRVNESLFDCIAKVSGKELIIDSSKSAQRLYLLKKYGRTQLRVIHLVRNGKAVVNSYLRKYGRPMSAIRRWAGVNITAILLKQMFPRDQWLLVSYEELATDPVTTLQRICGYLDIEYDDSMLRFRERIVHNLGGNRMRFGKNAQIFLDERWKTELNSTNALLFDLLVGFLNKYYDY